MGHASPYLTTEAAAEDALALSTIMSTLVIDYAVRQKSTRMTFFIVEQLPMLPRAKLEEVPAWLGEAVRAWINKRAIELFYTNWELRGLADSIGNVNPPYKWDLSRRATIQAEIDAAVLHLYGLDRHQANWVLDSFTVLRKYEERDYGEFRTKRLVLTAYDAMATAKRLGTAYLTPLSPLPADPILCHPTKVRAATAGVLPDGFWMRAAQQPNDAGAALTAILTVIDGPRPSRTIRLAAAMVLEPHLLTPLLPETRAKEWRRLVGQESEPRTGNVVGFAARTNQGWGAAVSNHRGNGRLIEDLSAGTWAPGPGLDAFDTAGWPDGRAGFVLEALAALDLNATVTSMPDEVRDWIAHASAA